MITLLHMLKEKTKERRGGDGRDADIAYQADRAMSS